MMFVPSADAAAAGPGYNVPPAPHSESTPADSQDRHILSQCIGYDHPLLSNNLVSFHSTDSFTGTSP